MLEVNAFFKNFIIEYYKSILLSQMKKATAQFLFCLFVFCYITLIPTYYYSYFLLLYRHQEFHYCKLWQYIIIHHENQIFFF